MINFRASCDWQVGSQSDLFCITFTVSSSPPLMVTSLWLRKKKYTVAMAAMLTPRAQNGSLHKVMVKKKSFWWVCTWQQGCVQGISVTAWSNFHVKNVLPFVCHKLKSYTIGHQEWGCLLYVSLEYLLWRAIYSPTICQLCCKHCCNH